MQSTKESTIEEPQTERLFFHQKEQIELKRIASGLLANSMTNLCSPQMLESLQRINEFKCSNVMLDFESRFGISYKRFLDEMRIVDDTYHSWRSNFPFEYYEWKEDLSDHLKDKKMILPNYFSFESWFDNYHESVLGLMPYQIITTKINSNHFKLYSEYQALIFDGFTEKQAVLKQKESVNINLPALKAEEKKTKYSQAVIMMVAKIVNEIEPFLPIDETDTNRKVSLTIDAIYDKLKFRVGNGIGNNFNPEDKLTKGHRKKVVELLNSLGFETQARAFKHKATNR